MKQRQSNGMSTQRQTREGGSSVSSSLLARLKANDPNGWRRLIQLFGPTIYGWCREAGLQPADAGDVSQEVFRAIVSGIGTFRRERPRDTFRGWLWRITQYKLSDHLRSKSKQPLALGGSSAHAHLELLPDPESFADSDAPPGPHAGMLAEILKSVRSEFGSKVWQACWLVVIEGQSAEEVGQTLNMSRGAVYVAKSRILKRLREELGDIVDF